MYLSGLLIEIDIFNKNVIYCSLYNNLHHKLIGYCYTLCHLKHDLSGQEVYEKWITIVILTGSESKMY